jgi:hypothetical protein
VSGLAAVSCVSSTACVAVGSSYSDGWTKDQPLVERWNGKRWSIQPTAGLQGDLTGVSCSSETACIAVGHVRSYVYGASPYEVTLVERWNGAKWSVQQTPTVGAGNSSLSGVSCVSPTACTAVGSHGPDLPPMVPLVERWDGKRWSIQPTPVPQSGGGLAGVSCTSTRSCMAVGSGLLCQPPWLCTSVWPRSLAERWNGKRWLIERMANPATLTGVSCTSPTACTAVGYPNSPIAGLPPGSLLAERWNGATWSMEPISTPLPLRASAPFLTDVSCASATACTATVDHFFSDAYGVRPINQPAIARWNGKRWSIQLLAATPGDNPPLMGVSCASTTTCTAVGFYFGDPPGTLVERWTRSG